MTKNCIFFYKIIKLVEQGIAVDVVHLGFDKSFEKVDLDVLLDKME